MRTESDAAVTSTFDVSNAVECGFDAEGAAHLMGILSNMYRDAPMAVLREYAANARDSHVQAGNGDPIQVTLPTEWEPKLVIGDQGVGLSEDEIITVYSRYGKSTKRDSDDEVGAFGIGAKSAFTISTQFTVTGIKDGRKTTALFALNAAGVGTVDIKARTATTERNGVTVTVAVDDPAAMRQAAKTLFATWEPGSVMVDARQPEHLPESMLTVVEGLYARRRDRRHVAGRTGLTIVMGGIPYPASAAMLRMVTRRGGDNGAVLRVIEDLASQHPMLHLLAVVPVGSVDITPSREDLRDTPRTIARLGQIVSDYVSQVDAAVERELAAEPTPMHVSARLVSLAGFRPLMTDGITWRGQRLTGAVTLPYPVIRLVEQGRSYRARYEDHCEFHLGQPLDGVEVVTGVDINAEKTIRRLARRYMTHRGLHTLLLVPDEQGQVGWFSYGGSSPLPTATFAAFKTEASTLPTVANPRREPRYEVLAQGHARAWPCSEIRRAVESGRRLLMLRRHYSQPHRQFIEDALDPSDLLVMLTGTQTENAFHRRFTDTVAAGPIIQDHARRTLDAATDQERRAMEFQRDGRIEHAEGLPELRALEPVKALIDEYRQRRNAYRAIGNERFVYLRLAQSQLGLGHERHDDQFLSGLPLLDLLLMRLPLVAGRDKLGAELAEHVTLYIDAVHAREQHQAAA